VSIDKKLKQKEVPLTPARGFLFIWRQFGRGPSCRLILPPRRPATKRFWLPTKPDNPLDETVLKPNRLINLVGQQRGSAMWAIIINLIYQQTCRSCLASMARHQHRWI